MSIEQIITFNLIVFVKAVTASWRNRHWYEGRARHRVSYLGTKDAIPAVDLIWSLRDERDFRRFTRLHDNTETMVLT